MKLKWDKRNDIVGKIHSFANYKEYTMQIATSKSSRNYSRYSQNDSIEMVTLHELLIYRNSMIIHVDSYKYDLRHVKKQAIEKLIELLEL